MGVPSSCIKLSITRAKVQAFQKPLMMLPAVSEHHVESPKSVPLLSSLPTSQPEVEAPQLAAAFIKPLNTA